MQKCSTTQLSECQMDAEEKGPKRSTLNFLKNFARAYTLSATAIVILN